MWCGRRRFRHPGGADIRRAHGARIDGDVHNRAWTRRDFVEEWIVSGRRDASAWSTTHATGTPGRFHPACTSSITSIICPCAAAQTGRIIIRSNSHSNGPPDYLHMLGQAAYDVSPIATKPDAACDGKSSIDEPDAW